MKSINPSAKLKTSPSTIDALPEVVSDIALDAELNNKPLMPWIFNEEGVFLGLLGEPPENVSAIVLEIDREKMAIELPNNLSNAIKQAVRRRTLQLGDRVRCIGRSQLDFSAGVIQLKAYCLFTHAHALIEPIRLTDRLTDKPKGKVMVCHKSGCKKRGGRQLVEALERTLRAQQLENAVEIQYTGCQKQCSKAPGLTIMPGGHRYNGINPRDVPALLAKHFSQTTL